MRNVVALLSLVIGLVSLAASPASAQEAGTFEPDGSAPPTPTFAVRIEGAPGLVLHVAPHAGRRDRRPLLPACTAPCSGRLRAGTYRFGVAPLGQDAIGAGRLQIEADSVLLVGYEDRSALRMAGAVMIGPALAAIVGGLAYGIAVDATRSHSYYDSYEPFGAPEDVLVASLLAGTGAILTIASAVLLGFTDAARVRVSPAGVAF